jgi:ribosomal protein L7Ae-like RNA K-turn-binding protein
MCNSQNKDKIIALLGLAAKAGKLVYGTPMVCEELKNGKKVYFVFRAAGTSENTEKRISDRCKYYGVTLIDLELNTTELAARLGKGGEIAAVALKDAGFAEGIRKLL